MNWVFIEPTDVWMFRDGHPFQAGAGHTARSVFPPLPLTLQGALRAWAIVDAGIRFDTFGSRDLTNPGLQALYSQIGLPSRDETKSGDLGKFEMAGPFLAKRQGDGSLYRYFPLPADLVRDDLKSLHLLQSIDPVGMESNWELTPLWTEIDVDNKEAGGSTWIREDHFITYLQNNRPPVDEYLLSHEALFRTEARTGISVDYYGEDGNGPTGRVREGMLYQAAFIRPAQDVGLLVSTNLDMGSSGLLALGGERHSASYTTKVKLKADYTQAISGPQQHLKIIFLTPAYFEPGWKPRNDNWGQFFTQGTPELVSVALKRPIQIGGWDLSRGCARTMYNYIAPGSVLYFRAKDGSAPLLLKNNSMTETPPEGFPTEGGAIDVAERMGFGQIAIGIW